ncbi:MAG: cytochrome c biogenesis protein CcsA [Bacteroidales bacterium]|nr:cytochrome c biogenesis protein CcsA [Bacteroidales bacterium]MBR6929466.1 cytochrome c biogenesis protein CcsA [Bacteroidales bacterium]
MKYVRHITSVLIILLIAVLAAGTVVEKLHGSDFARIHVYGAWWFVALWALVALLIVYMAVKCKMWKQLAVGVLHLSILFILLGALLTMLTGQHGRMKLEPNRPNSHFFINEHGEITKEALPFSLTLDRFEIETYPNSSKPKDYVSYLRLSDGQTQKDVVISMNNILKHKHYRFYQSDYDDKGNSILDVARDPWGIGVTYTGYALLFLSLVALVARPSLRGGTTKQSISRQSSRVITISWLSVLVVLLVVLYIRMLTHPLLPVLRSPFFSLHISTIVTAYALLLGILVVGVIALIRPKNLARMERLKSLSMAMLYPAVALLAIGIFIGAIWANVSWGNYWSWDPKEVWALITLLIYAAPLHEKLWKSFQKPLFFHIYGILAFLSVAFTYFGVNLLLGGVHAYN